MTQGAFANSASAISGFAQELAGRLAFDRELALAVREEVEDHLWEAAAAHQLSNAAVDPLEAQRRAVANFGDPRLIAAQIAAVSLAGQARRLGITAVLVLACILLAMTTRVTWYEMTQWALCENAVELGETLGLIDRAAFLLAALGGVAGWLSSGGRLRFWAVATGGLVACVACDGLLTALRLSGWEFSTDFVVPLLTMAIEAACAAILVFHIRRMSRRTTSAAALLRG